MFSRCESLKSLPNISRWNKVNVMNMSSMFSHCKSLENFPKILSWKINNDINIDEIFFGCKYYYSSEFQYYL